jgi:hypothetical protein
MQSCRSQTLGTLLRYEDNLSKPSVIALMLLYSPLQLLFQPGVNLSADTLADLVALATLSLLEELPQVLLEFLLDLIFVYILILDDASESRFDCKGFGQADLLWCQNDLMRLANVI